MPAPPPSARPNAIAHARTPSPAQLELDAYAAHASTLQARLVSTLDALQRARLEHADALSAARRREESLRARLAAARTAAGDAEAARDELREGVALLLEQVELCNDYALWPHSGLHAPSLALPIAPMPMPAPPRADAGAPDHDASRAHAASVVGALQAQAARAAQNNADLQARVGLLEAQLAQRDLELALAAQPAACARCAPALDARRARATREDAIRLLERSAARNRVLADEIAVLVQRLEHVRAARSLPPSPEGSPTLSLERDLSLGLVPPPAPAEETTTATVTVTRKAQPRRPPTPHPREGGLGEEPPSPTRVGAQKVFVVKGEREGEGEEEEDLRGECERLRAALAASQAEVARLRSQARPPPSPAPPQSSSTPPPPLFVPSPPPLSAPQPLRPPSGPIQLGLEPPPDSDADTDADSEQSVDMELASPLQPTLTMLRGADVDADPAPPQLHEPAGPAPSGSLLSPLPHLNMNRAVGSLQLLNTGPLSAASAGPLSAVSAGQFPAVFTLRPAPTSDSPALSPN